jgi:hypothetical protein
LKRRKRRAGLAKNENKQNAGTNIHGGGDYVIKSALYNKDTGKTNDPVNYAYQIKNQDLSMTYSNPDCSKTQDTYIFGQILKPSCAWNNYNQYHDVFLYGDGQYQNSTTVANVQSYAFKASNSNTVDNIAWNYTYYATESVFNRALGKATTGSLSVSNQASNINVATPLQSPSDPNLSYLLGLQAINPTSTLDTNSNRPQLNTLYRIVGDNSSDFNGYAVPDDSKTNNTITGAKARTGDNENYFFVCQVSLLKKISNQKILPI